MRVALAEDGALFREGLLMLLKAAGHEIVACASGGDELVALLRTRPADVAILDIRMPPEPDGGLVTAERLRATYPDMGLLFLSHYAESHYLMRILEIGTDAIGYRLKEKVGSVEVLTDTLNRIADGEIVIVSCRTWPTAPGSCCAACSGASSCMSASARPTSWPRSCASRGGG
jgi:DNA-binding NarL/FixJ family response regulator